MIKHRIESMAAKEALAYLLLHEKLRHLKDIAEIDKDLAKLEAQGVRIPDNINADEWFIV